ncbi:MAG: DUF3450 domain-containing protein [Pseudomonadales bacterium]|nr:DUF3450 domain-containing protein [Pseudomonadales bacterium]
MYQSLMATAQEGSISININTKHDTEAAPLDKLLLLETNTSNHNQRTQNEVSSLSSETSRIKNEYRQLSKKLDSLYLYNKQLKLNLEDQKRQQQELQLSIIQATEIERQITPLMIRMISSLEQFIALDLPFLQQERKERLSHLREIFNRSDVSISEKFRKILEAYRLELAYGRSTEAYPEVIIIHDTPQQVTILKVGRIGMYYQTLDGKKSAVWDVDQDQWTRLSGEYNQAIKQGIQIAKKQFAPELISIPLRRTNIKSEG